MSDCTDSQDVGLEAATIERVRNSSLVEWSGTDNETRLKPDTEARDCGNTMVGERSRDQRSQTERTGGEKRSENAGMSSAMSARTRHTESLRVPGQRQSSQGKSGPKPRTKKS
jgi:hypothetical protein